MQPSAASIPPCIFLIFGHLLYLRFLKLFRNKSNNEIGFVVGYNKKELKNRPFEILVDNELRKPFKVNEKKKSKDYDWNEIIEKIEKVYEKVLLKQRGEQ